MAIKLITKAIPQHKFDAIEIHPNEAQFWSVYIRYNPKSNVQQFGGLERIADADTEIEANELKTFLTAFVQKAE